MQYRPFKELKLSQLGFGTMRFPIKYNNEKLIDEKSAGQCLQTAIDAGVNYFDTAYGYHDGRSEVVMGNALRAYPRDSFYLADKFPGYDLANIPKVEEIFEEQLKRCGVEYFDFYLFHNVCEMNIGAYLDPQYGIYDYLLRQKANGRIRHLGFSVHGSYDVMQRFLDAYGESMEFGQVQLNYIDWHFQNAEAKVKRLGDLGIPVWVMEPLRGGKLAALPAEQAKHLHELRPQETVPGWAFRFLQTIPNATVTLSGMSNFQQLRENIHTFETEEPLNAAEMQTLFELAAAMTSQTALPCTACRYCTSHCPQQLDIPALLALYNEHSFTGGGFLAPMALSALPEDKQPSACIGCRSCEAVCPQQIKISEALADFAKMLKS